MNRSLALGTTALVAALLALLAGGKAHADSGAHYYSPHARHPHGLAHHGSGSTFRGQPGAKARAAAPPTAVPHAKPRAHGKAKAEYTSRGTLR
jgi:hypothetical protein